MRCAWLFAAMLALTGCATVPPVEQEQSQRQVASLGEDWLFRYQDGWSAEQAAASGVADWEAVSLPHSWNRLGEYRETRTDATDNRQGTGWYRRTIDGRSLDPDKRHFAEFDAVGNVADVWLNGRHLAHHAGAFTRFRVELNPALDFTGPNILLVRADNSDPQPGSTTQDVVPLLGDFFIHGGIYRQARLVSVPASHIALDDFGGPGVYAMPRVEQDSSATIDVLVRLTAARARQRVAIELLDVDGRRAASQESEVAAGQREVRMSLIVARPRLWNGRADPYVYSLVATLTEGSSTLDRVSQPLGIRRFHMDPDTGFSLNGKMLQLRGVSRHQDRLGKGWAISEADENEDMALTAEMGVNSIRVAHYPQSTHWFDLADRTGMIVWAEVPFVNKVSFGDAAATPALVANARTQMTEMIRQYSNHPSIVTWGIGNEVDIDMAFGRLGPKADARPLLRDLQALTKAEDPSRPTVLADFGEETPSKKVDYLPQLTGITDLMGYNRYFGWYYGKVEDLGPHLDRLHALHPDVPISVSEYGAGGALTQHSNHPEGRPFDLGRLQPEEYQSWWHERSWPQIRERPYLWGSWIWNMFDFSSRVRKEGDAIDINTKGLVSYDRKVKKDAFFYYKAQWSDEPVVHITSRRFVERTDAVTRVKVYSNAASVAVTLNGRSLGDAPCIDRICTVDNVRLASGANTVIAKASFANGEVGDAVEWRLVP